MGKRVGSSVDNILSMNLLVQRAVESIVNA